MPVASTLRTRTFRLLLGLTLLAAGSRAWAQPSNADAIARKAYSARYDRAYLLGGFAYPNYKELNDQLSYVGGFPKLKPGALLIGFGYGQGFGSIGLALEWRMAVRANDVDSSDAYTNLLTNSLSLLGRYNLFVTNRSTLSVMFGPSYNRLNLTFKEPIALFSVPSSFGAQIVAGGNKRKLFQSQFGLSAGLQWERHFSWLRRNDVQACGRARQITVGLRAQYDYVAKTYRWHTENPNVRRSTKLDPNRKPFINPVGLSGTLVVGGLFNRY